MIHPDYITGYVDGEGSFLISFSPRNKIRLGLEVRPSFSVSQRMDRSEVLSIMKSYFGCGSIRFSKSDQTRKYEVRSLRNLNELVIPHFRKYPIYSSKKKDFELFAQICEMMKKKDHGKPKGLSKIINVALKMNPNGSRKYSKRFLFSKLKI